MEFTTESLLIGTLAAFCFGMSKTGVVGCGIFGVIIMVAAFGDQAKLSAGAVVPLLLAADLMAVHYYVRDCDWSKIRLLAIPVLIGMAVGGYILHIVDDRLFCIILGGFVLAMILFEQLRSYMQWNDFPHSKPFGWVMGVLGGSSTTIANAGGPVMIVYVSSLGFNKDKMMGTIAVFFFLVNIAKLPIVASAGLITRETLLFDIYVLPGLIVGALIGRRIYLLIPEKWFMPMVTVMNVLAALIMLAQ